MQFQSPDLGTKPVKTSSSEEVKGGERLTSALAESGAASHKLPVEVGGRDGPEPTRFGDWEKAGRCIDF